MLFRGAGHGGTLAIIAATPLVALILVLIGRTLGPHPWPHLQSGPRSPAADCPAAPAGAPAELPRGYRFLWEFSGGYGANGREVTWVYSQSCADPDPEHPVLVMHLDPLAGGQQVQHVLHGRPVDVGVRGADAVYYDGWVAPDDVRRAFCPLVECRWDTPRVNVLVLTRSGGTYAILGTKSDGIGSAQLVTIAHRLLVPGDGGEP